MNVAEMRRRVQSVVGDPDEAQFSATDILDWLNEAQRRIAKDTQYIGGHFETHVVADQKGYELPADTVVLERVELDTKRLARTTLEQLDNIDEYQTTKAGVAKMYYVYGNVLYLYPTPEEAGVGNLDIWYKRLPTELLNDTDVPEVEPSMHDTMVRFAIARAKEKEEDYGVAGQIMTGVDIDTTQLAHESDQRSQDTYPAITPTPDDEGWWFS